MQTKQGGQQCCVCDLVGISLTHQFKARQKCLSSSHTYFVSLCYAQHPNKSITNWSQNCPVKDYRSLWGVWYFLMCTPHSEGEMHLEEQN